MSEGEFLIVAIPALLLMVVVSISMFVLAGRLAALRRDHRALEKGVGDVAYSLKMLSVRFDAFVEDVFKERRP